MFLICVSRKAYNQQLIANNHTLQRARHSNNGINIYISRHFNIIDRIYYRLCHYFMYITEGNMLPLELYNNNFSLLMYFIWYILGYGLLFELFRVFCKNKKKIFIKYIISKKHAQRPSLSNIFLTDLLFR